MPQRIILFGNGSDYSTAVLRNLLESGLKPLAVGLPEYQPANVDSKTSLADGPDLPVDSYCGLANAFSIPVIYAPPADKLKIAEQLLQLKSDYLLVACWPYLLPASIVSAVNKLALNLHPSLLPHYKGVNPVNDQLANRETRFGVTLHKLSQEFDSGEIIGQREFAITEQGEPREQIESIAAIQGVQLFIEAMQITQ